MEELIKNKLIIEKLHIINTILNIQLLVYKKEEDEELINFELIHELLREYKQKVNENPKYLTID